MKYSLLHDLFSFSKPASEAEFAIAANDIECLYPLDQRALSGAKVVIMTVSLSINTLAVAKLVPLRPGLERCDEQDEKLGERQFESHALMQVASLCGFAFVPKHYEIY